MFIAKGLTVYKDRILEEDAGKALVLTADNTLRQSPRCLLSYFHTTKSCGY